MWETLVRPPRGRLSARKFIVFFIALLVVCFSYSAILAPTAHAADASWNNDGALVYGGRTYDTSAVADPTVINIPEGATYYTSIDNESNPPKAYVIYFANGTSPPDAKQATYVTFNYANGRYTNKSALTTISITPQATAQQNAGTKSCAVDEVGWIICPLTNFLANAMDYIYGAVSAFLEVRPLATTSNQAMYRAWDYMRNIANIVFFIAFMFVIYSQVSGFGMSNYGIKRVLPRVFIAAILVNTSYWICAIAIDIFNILGYSVQDVFESVRNSLVGSESNSVISWKSMASFVLSGGTAAVGGGVAAYLGITTATAATAGAAAMGSTAIIALLYLLLPLLISVLFVVLMTFIILAARQAIITIFVVLAPLAFVAYLLPNTEEWFTKWRKALFTLLLVFPAFSLVFGGAQLASAIIIQNATDLNMILLAMGVQVAPLAITPLLLRLGGGILNRVAGIVNNPAKGVFDRSKNWARDRSGEHQAAGLAALSERAKQKGFVNGRSTKGGKVRRAASRFNPNNMAYHREYNRRRREGMKSANEALTEGYFAGTTAGTQIQDMQSNATTMKHAHESINKEAWARRTYGNPATGTGPNQIGHLHHQGEMASGRTKLIEEAAASHANRELQTQINTGIGVGAAGLRNLKIQSDVDTSHAEFHASRVKADGKLAFQNEVMGDRALRLMNRDRVAAEKEAAVIENTLQKRADAHWDRQGTQNARVQELRLREIEATDSAKLAETQFNTVVSDIKVRGADAQGFLAIDRNIGKIVRDQQQAITVGEKHIAELNSDASSRAETAFIKSTSGQRVSRQAQAARDALEAAKGKEAAIVQEWRTEEGAKGLTGEQASIAKALMEADVQKRAQNQRTNIATTQANNEYAGKVMDNEVIIPDGTDPIAVVAGGIAGTTGVSQAKATATQVIFEAFDKAVSAEKTLVSRVPEGDILGENVPDPNDPSKTIGKGLGSADILNEPEERIAALGGTIAKRSHQESHIKLWARMGELGRKAKADLTAAEASGDEQQIKAAKANMGKVKSLEQQVMGDKSKKPFGVGDGDLGKANIGQYDDNIYETTRKRIHTHMSAQTLATMDPDDIRLIFEMGRAGKLSAEELGIMDKAYKEWEEDSNLKASIQDKHRALLDPLRQHATDAASTARYPQAYPQGDPSDPKDFWNSKFTDVDGLDDPVNP